MKKINIFAVLLMAQATFASTNKSSHPIYFNGGDVKPHQLVTFDLPYTQMSPGVLYDLSCVIMSNNVTSQNLILNIKISSDRVADAYSDPLAPITLINNIKVSYPFQDRLMEETNTILFHHFVALSEASRLSVYNFDDVSSVNFSNCYIIVSNQNA